MRWAGPQAATGEKSIRFASAFQIRIHRKRQLNNPTIAAAMVLMKMKIVQIAHSPRGLPLQFPIGQHKAYNTVCSYSKQLSAASHANVDTREPDGD